MFSHVHLGSNDPARAKRFYDALFAVLGASEGVKDPDRDRYYYRHEGALFIIGAPLDGEPASPGNGGTVGFKVSSTEQGDAWHAAGIAHGGTAIEDPPGVRTKTAGVLYLAYLRDPDGNKLCAMKFMNEDA